MDQKTKIKIINSPDSLHPFAVLDKPAGIPSAPLHDSDESALAFAIENFPEIKKISGKKNVEHGLIHSRKRLVAVFFRSLKGEKI